MEFVFPRRKITGCVAALILLGYVSGAAAQAATLPQFGHVILVVEENHDYIGVVGNPTMPYLNSLISQYGLATNYYAVTHPSLGNYFSLTTGQILTNNDNSLPLTFSVSADNIVRELIKSGKTWKDYAESIPSVGYLGGDIGEYEVAHDPIPYFTDVNCGTSACVNQAAHIVPSTQFASDLSAGSLPRFSLIVPNSCDDGEDCPQATSDSWLKSHIAPLVANSAFRQNGLLIILYDEDIHTTTPCTLTGTACGGRVAAVVVSPRLKASGLHVATYYNHASTLRTILQGLGVTTFPGASAWATPMSDFFSTPAPLSGVTASLSSKSLSFSSVDVGTTGPAKTITLKNSGSGTMDLSGIAVTPPFSETSTCQRTLDSGASCTISVKFLPLTSGAVSRTLSIYDNAYSGSPQTVSLSGTGVWPSSSGRITLSPSSLSFGTVSKGSKSAPQAVTLHNGTSSSIAVVNIWIGWSYSETNYCGSSLAAGASCTIDVTFAPLGTGAIKENLLVRAGSAYLATSLTGTGAGVVTLSPSSLSFGSVRKRGRSSAPAATLTNGTSSAVNIYSVRAGWSYTETNNCGSSLAAGASCTDDAACPERSGGTSLLQGKFHPAPNAP